MTVALKTRPALLCLGTALLILTGEAAFAHGAYHDVVQKLTRFIEEDPYNTELRYKLAAAHVEHDEWQLALDECDHIEKIAPSVYQLGYFRGRSLATAKRWHEALAPLDEFLKSAPADEEALVWRARVFLQTGNPAKAASDYRAALKKSTNPSHHIEFAKSLVAQNLPQLAVSALQPGLLLTNNDPGVLECMVACATAAKDHNAALAAIDGLIKTWPRPEQWMLRRAKYLASIGRNEEALAAWKALDARLMALPNLERAQPFLQEIRTETHTALGIKSPAPVVAPPAGMPNANAVNLP